MYMKVKMTILSCNLFNLPNLNDLDYLCQIQNYFESLYRNSNSQLLDIKKETTQRNKPTIYEYSYVSIVSKLRGKILKFPFLKKVLK